MKTILSTIALTMMATTLSSNVFASDNQYKMEIYTLSNSAVVKITQDGVPVSNVPVEVKGLTTRTMTTSEHGTITVKNNSNYAHSFRISVTEPNGKVISTERFISEHN
jgi:hypothetical protein